MSRDKFGRHIQHRNRYFDDDDGDFEYFDLQNKRLVNLAQPLYDGDAVNKAFLNKELNKVIYLLSEHKKSAGTNIEIANEIITDIQSEIDHLYSSLKLTKPPSKPAVGETTPFREVQNDPENIENKQPD